MSDIKPWMRRAARENIVNGLKRVFAGVTGYVPEDDPIITDEAVEIEARAIAAHAPPVEEMQKALQEIAEYYVLGKTPPPAGMWQRVGESLTAYDDWLKREEATDGAC